MTTENLNENLFWKKCSSCKKPIGFGEKYQVCSVSTCNSKKLGLAFCSIPCWDAHLGFANHRESSAIETKAPMSVQNSEPKKTIVRTENTSALHPGETDTLVVVSKVKKFINDSSTYNTSACAIEALTEIVVKECLKAIANAKSCGRKTVMGRDF